MAEKDKNVEKFYTPEEVALAILKKTQELLRNSPLFKANTSHEVEAGEEPNNDDAECPPSLEDADIENSGDHGKKKAKKAKSGIEDADKDGDGDIDGDDAIEAQEELTGEDLDGDNEVGESKEHKEKIDAVVNAPKKTGDSEDKDASEKIEDVANKDDKKDKKPPFKKPEEVKKHLNTGAALPMTKKAESCDPKMDLKKPSLKKFMLKRKMKKSAGPTADSRVAEKLSGAPAAPVPQEKIKEQPSPAAQVKAQPKLQMEKNKATEKLLGIKPRAGK